MGTTTIRIDHDALPDQFDLSRPDAVAEVIEVALREDGIAAEVSDVISHLKIELPTALRRRQRIAGRDGADLSAGGQIAIIWL